MKIGKKRATKNLKEPDSEKSGRSHVVAAVFIGLSTFLAYSVSLHGTWALDDGAVGQFRSLGSVLSSKVGYREIAYLSFLLNQWINPLDPLNYRVMNIVIHLVNSLLVYSLAFVTFRLPEWKEKFGRYGFPVALTSGLVFALHPLNINAVAYIVQRMASLATMFVLLALLSYIFGRTANRRALSALYYAFSAMFAVFGIFSKENAVMVVPLILLYEYFFLIGPDKSRYLKRLALGVPAAVALVAGTSFFLGFHKALFSLFDLFLHPNSPISGVGWTAVDVYWTPAQHVLTEFRVLARYLMLIVVPLPGYLVFDWWGFPLSRSFLHPASTLAAAMLIFALLGFAVWNRKRLPFLSFGILWYLISISLESFVAIGSDLYFEHRNYLPLTGLIIGVTAQAATLFRPEALRSRRVWAVTVVLAVSLGSLTFQRNHVWKDSVTLWSDTVRKAPENLRALVALGNAYLGESDLKSAEIRYEQVMKMSDEQGRAGFYRDSSYSLGMVYLFSKDLQGAGRIIKTMNSRIADPVATDILKGFYDSINDEPESALRRFDAVFPRTEGLDRVIVLTLRGDVYREEGLSKKALDDYGEALQLSPSFSAAYYGIGSVYLTMGRLDEAFSFMQKTLALDPGHALALADAADISMVRKEPLDVSLSFARRAVSKSTPFYQPYATMGSVMIVAGQDREAEDFYRLAVEHGMKDYMVPFLKARAYHIKGDDAKAGIFLRELASVKDLPENLRRIVGASLKRMQ